MHKGACLLLLCFVDMCANVSTRTYVHTTLLMYTRIYDSVYIDICTDNNTDTYRQDHTFIKRSTCIHSSTHTCTHMQTSTSRYIQIQTNVHFFQGYMHLCIHIFWQENANKYKQFYFFQSRCICISVFAICGRVLCPFALQHLCTLRFLTADS